MTSGQPKLRAVSYHEVQVCPELYLCNCGPYLLIKKESLQSLKKTISKCLSEKEKQVLELYLAGESYANIADKLKMSQKSVDNALQRIRRKLRKHISNITL